MEISVLQWNILADHLSGNSPTLGDFDNVTADMLDWNTRKAKIIATITNFWPHIIALQECDHFDELADELYNYKGYLAIKPASSPEGICLFVKNDDECIVDVCKCITFTYMDYKGQPTNQPAIIIHIKLTNKENLIIATTHLKATKTAEGEAIRRHQMEQLLSHIKRIKPSEDTPVILLGDLNSMPVFDSVVGQPLTYETMTNSDLRLTSVFDVTLPTTIKSRKGHLTSRCIDYIMYSNVSVKDSDHGYYDLTQTPKLGDNIQISEGWPSDHAYLYAVFNLQE